MAPLCIAPEPPVAARTINFFRAAMGNSCAKSGPMEDEGGGDGQKAGFRDRRLSVSQVPNESSPNRRLSVYADEAVNESAAQVLTHIATVSVKSVAGMEPVPGLSLIHI